MGEYVEGLPGQNNPFSLVYCAITEDDYVFRRGTNGVEIGKISRNSIKAINIAKREEAKQPWSVKKPQYYCLEINWNDFDTAKQKAVFKFTEKKSADLANEAAQTLRKWEKLTEKPSVFVNA